jgi:hypothetical protein
VDAVIAGEGHTANVLDDEGDRVHGLAVGRGGLVEGVPAEGGRVREDLLGVAEADGLVEPLATGGVGGRVRGVERDCAGRRGQGQEGSDCGQVELHLCCASSVAGMDQLLNFGCRYL